MRKPQYPKAGVIPIYLREKETRDETDFPAGGVRGVPGPAADQLFDDGPDLPLPDGGAELSEHARQIALA
jgi:hypothetical protein